MNIIKIFSAFLGLFLLQGVASAQNNEVSGVVIDIKDGTGIAGAIVRLIAANDTTLTEGAVTGMDGHFHAKIAGVGSYVLMVSSIGYTPIRKTVDLIGTPKNVGVIRLASSSITLKTVTISGQQIRASQNGDTSSFVADAYKVNMDATAEDLIKKMPGITSDNNGLKANGEEVKKVLVDGKPFFGEDPNATLKNLPAEIIDKVEIFDNQSDQARFTGFNDGNQEKTLNFITKKGKNEGVFGKVYAGYGINDRYQGSLTFNYFKGVRRISLLGLSNNINQQNFSIADVLSVMSNTGGANGQGVPQRNSSNNSAGTKNAATSFGGPGGLFTSQQSGITKTNSAGLNFNDEWGKKIKVSGSYFFNNTDNNNESELLQHYFTDTSLSYNQNGNTQTQNTNHRTSLRVEYAMDDVNAFTITPRITFQNNQYNAILSSKTQQGTTTLNGTATNQAATTKGYSFTNNILYQHKFWKKGRTTSLNLGQQLSNSNGSGSYYSDSYYDTSSAHMFLDQQYTNINHSATFSGTLSYTEPVGKNSQLMVSYSSSYTKSEADKKTSDLNASSMKYDYLDTILSNQYSRTYTTQRGGIAYRYGNQRLNINVGADIQLSQLNGNQIFPVSFTTSRAFSSALPSAILNYKIAQGKNLNIRYHSSNTAPSITQLQGVPDVSNPLQITTGNADLKQTSEHQLMFRYGNVNKKNGHSFFIFGMANYTADYISNATIIATKDTFITGGYILNASSQLIQPVNLDQYYTVRTNAVYSLPVKWLKSNLNTNVGLNYIHTPALLNGKLNYSTNTTASGGIYLGSNISQNIDFSLSYNGSYNVVSNTINTQSDNSYYNGTATLRVNIILAGHFVLNTDITNILYSGLSQDYNQNFLLWNAYIGYKFLKDRSLEVKMSVFDILNQNNSVSRTITEAYTQDTRTNTLQQYGMMTLTYTIMKFQNGSSMPESQLPKDMPPGLPPVEHGTMGPPPGGN